MQNVQQLESERHQRIGFLVVKKKTRNMKVDCDSYRKWNCEIKKFYDLCKLPYMSR